MLKIGRRVEDRIQLTEFQLVIIYLTTIIILYVRNNPLLGSGLNNFVRVNANFLCKFMTLSDYLYLFKNVFLFVYIEEGYILHTFVV